MYHTEILEKCNPRWARIIRENGYQFLGDQRKMNSRPSIADINRQLARNAFSTDRVAVACLWDNSENFFRFFEFNSATKRLKRLGTAAEATPPRPGVAPERLPTMEDFWTHNIDAKKFSPGKLAEMMGLAEEAEDRRYAAAEAATSEKLDIMADETLCRVESGVIQTGRAYSYDKRSSIERKSEGEKPDALSKFETSEILGGMDPDRIKRYIELAGEAGSTRDQMAERLEKALKTKRPNTTLGRIVAGLEKTAAVAA